MITDEPIYRPANQNEWKISHLFALLKPKITKIADTTAGILAQQ
jgi:hypothetical protein